METNEEETGEGLAIISEQTSEPKTVKIELERLHQVLEQDGYRYYEDPVTKAQYSVDSSGYWFLFDTDRGCYEPIVPVISNSQESQKPATGSEHVKQVKSKKLLINCGVPFDNDGHPIYPTNKEGLPILPVDENGTPFFPMDEYKRPVFPWDFARQRYTFPVDDTDEPIFPRNDHNKPIVLQDDKGEPVFPVDKSGTFIFPLDETNCPIPALTIDGRSVVPKDEYGNFVIPKDREGKHLIHIASDGVTALSMADWKQWKKYYKDTNRIYQQQQQHIASVPVTSTAAPVYSINSIFHPLSLEQHNAFFAQDIEMLQRSRRVRPEDIDLPNMDTNGVPKIDVADGQLIPNQQMPENEQQKKNKKYLIDQLKFAKKSGALPKKELQDANDGAKVLEKNERESRLKDSKKEKKRKKKNRRSNSSRSSSSTPKKKRRKSESKKKRSKRHRSASTVSSNSAASDISTNTYSSQEDYQEKHRASSRQENKDVGYRTVAYLRDVPSVEQKQTVVTRADYANGDNSDMSMSDTEQPIPIAPPKPQSTKQKTETLKHLTLNNDEHIDIKVAAKSGNLSFIRACFDQTRNRYNDIKLQMAELEVQRSLEKRNLTILREAAKRLEHKKDSDYISSSDATS